MAKTKNIQLGIDLQIQNYNESIKELELIEQQGGAAGKAASKLKKEVIEAKNALIALGSTATPQELKKFIKINGDLASKMSDIAHEAEQVQRAIAATKKSYETADAAAKKHKETLESLKTQQEELDKATKKRKSTRAVEKLNSAENADYKARLDKREVGKNAQDKDAAYWSAIQRDAKGTGKDAEAAQKILAEVNKETDDARQKLQNVKTQIAETTKEYEKLKAAADGYKKTLTELEGKESNLKVIAEAIENATDSINENNEALMKARDSAVKAGQSHIKLTKATDETNSSFTKAARSVFNYTVLYQGLKKVLRESVRTIKEMDDAITGMTVVTNLSRKEAWAQVESFKEIAKATSSTMTEIAGLTTEYLKQGRAMKEAKILAEETAKSAKIAGISTAEAVQYMTSAINGFNLAATEATRVSDIFANLAAASATDFEDLAIAVSKVSAQANLAGMSIEYTTALLAKGIETTQEAPESIGTALKTIVARMRELSSYGSVLEDGGSVNKVERALASAGIELRNVNGEFRNLEEIFNELGPKWDYLNTMQQQAIAQAVAGTRQQSRFVAIMQDWGRTQELIAEANASQGASAAQYYEYANGIEAALTRMKTSWEGFVQGLTNNKLIIGGINTVTKIIESINKIPQYLKIIVGIYLGIVMINRLRENHEIKMKAYRQMAMTDAEKERASQQKTLGSILEEKKLLKQKAEALKENLKLQQELEKEVKLQATQRENDAIQRLQLLEKEIAIRKKDGNATADLEKQRLETIKEIEQLRIDRAKERRALEQEIVEIESRKSANKEWQTRQSKEKERDSKIKAADDEIVELEKKKLNTKDEAEVAKIDAQIKDLQTKKKEAVKEFEDYIKTGLSRYDETIESLDKQEKILENELKKEGLSEEDRNTKQAELNKVKEKKKTLTDEQTLFRDKEFDSQDVDFGQINEDLDKEQKQRQDRININKSEKEINLDKDIAAQQAIIDDDKTSKEDKEAAEVKLNALLEDRKKLLEELNAEDGKNVEFLVEKEQRLVKQLELEEQALNAKKNDVEKLEQELENDDIPVKPEKSAEKLKGYGFSVDDPEKFKEETAVDGENSDIVGDSEIAGDIEAYQQYLELMEQRRLKEEELKALKAEQAQIEENISNIGNEITTVQTEARNAATTEEIAKQTELKALKEEQTQLETELQAAKQYTMTASEQALYNENKAAMERLAIEQRILENKKRQLEIAIATGKKEGKDTSKQEAALKKLNKTITKNKQTINRLDAKNKKLADGSFNVYQKMADLIGSKLGVNFKAMVDDVKTVVDFSKKLVTDFIELWKNLSLRIKGEKEITDEKNKQNTADTVSNTNQAIENAQKGAEVGAEKTITDEKKKQGNEQKKTLITAIASLFTKKGEAKAEKDSTKEKKKGFWAGLKNAFANISASAGQPYGAGLPFAIAGLAILSIIGVATSGIKLGSSSSNQSKEQKVAAKQNANYEMKKTNASATKALTEYNELRNKKVKTEEDEKRIAELESELQELDEKFKGLRGNQLANEVATRIAANKAVINKNVQESFDLVVKMKHDIIDESAVARQALADKMILSQEQLIASNSQLADLEQTQVDAITNTASTMATELANSAAWDEIYDSKKEKKENLEDDLEQFARASTEFAIAMETNASDDISDQITAFENGIEDLTKSLEGTSEEFREAALSTVKAQYKSISYLSEVQSEAGKEMIDAIKSIVDKTDGRLTTEKLLKFSDVVIGATTEQQNTLSDALNAYSEEKSFGQAKGNFLGINTGKNGEEHVGATKQDRNLEELRNAFGLDENASIEDVQKEMGKYIKTNSDGTLKIDKNGNYAFKATGHGLSGNNKHLTEIYKNLTATVEALGPYADLSETAATSLKEFVDSVQNVKTTLSNTLTSIDKQLLDNETLLNENTKQNVKLTGNMGYAVMKAAREAADDIERLAEENIAKLEQEKANATSESDKNAIQDAINLAKEQAHKDATAILAEAESMIGYMGDSDWLNRSEALESKRDNVQDIYDALWEEKDLSVEQVQTLYNDIIPDLVKNNPQLSVQDLYKTFTEGGPLALSYINEYLEDFNKYAELTALDTLGHDQEKLEDSLNDLFNSGFTWEGFEIQYDADGIVDIEKTLAQLPQQAIEEYMSGGEYDWEDEFETLTNDISTYYKNMAQYDASKTELEKEEKLTPEEIRRANLEARIAKLSESSLTHRIELIKLELELNKELSDELSKQLQTEKEKWNKALEGFDLSNIEDRDRNGIIDIDDILKIENGQVEIIEDVYNGLDEQLKIHITKNLDGLKEIVEAHYDTVKKEIELEEEKFEEYVDIQETLIDAYKDQLEKEQETLEEALDKRKELYQEYFDWLNNQESEDETENDIEILRQRVTNLSGATDAASLKAYKDAVEELEDLEKEQIQSEQDKIQEQILANLDKQSEMVEEYYDQQLEDNKAILQAINNLAASDTDALLDLLKSADDYDNLTAEQQLQKDKEYAQLLSGWSSAKSTSQVFYDWWADNPDAPYDQVLAKRKELLGYSEGGLVDFTGLAMVHGSSTKPEAFLNAEQTALFAKLGETLVVMSSQGLFGKMNDMTASTINNNLTIENFDITINADMKDDQDIYNTGQTLADVFFDRIQASGIPVNIKK